MSIIWVFYWRTIDGFPRTAIVITQTAGHAVRRVGVAMVLLFASRTSNAQSPERDAGSHGLVRWGNNTTITVYLPPDPDAGALPGRRAKLIAGMKLWFDDPTLKNRNIKLAVTDVASAVNVPNVVSVKWSPAGTVKDADGNKHQGEGGPAYDPNVKDASGNHTPTAGEMEIDRGVTNLKEAFNLGAHEMGHVLGVGHGKSNLDVMYPTIRTDDELPLSDHTGVGDIAELQATYLANNNDTKIDVVASVTTTGPLFRYTYTTTWLSGGPMAVFQIETHGAGIFDIAPADGWMVDNFLPPDDWLDLRTGVGTGVFLGFVHQRDEFNLDDDNRVLTFAFSSLRAPGRVQAFLNGAFDTVGPTVVPEPSVLRLLLFAVGLCAVVAIRRMNSATTD